jgi:hypothetical protein
MLSLFARIGAIDILIHEAAPTPAPTPRPTDETSFLVSPAATSTRTPALRATQPGAVDHSLALFELGEPVTLAEARRLADFELSAPAALGEPDEVYVHRGIDLPAVTLVWRDEDDMALSLTEIGVAEFAEKMVHDQAVRTVTVNERPAVWLAGPHRLQLLGNWQTDTLLIESNVLIWVADEVTYRLEGDLTEEEMVVIAESLPPTP